MMALKLIEKITPSQLDNAVISHVNVVRYLTLAINFRLLLLCRFVSTNQANCFHFKLSEVLLYYICFRLQALRQLEIFSVRKQN